MAGAGGCVVFKEDDAAHVVVADVADDMVFVGDGGAAEAHEEYFADVLLQLVGGVDYRG